MELINIYDAVRAVDRHMLEDGTLDNDISCILEEVTPVMIPQKASSSYSHEKDVQPEPEESFEKCSDCIHADDSEDMCILRRCKHAIAETVECFEPKQPDLGKYEYHYDHTDCIWYRPEARNRCPVTCAQYRDGWNDAMNYIFRDGKGYRPYRRGEQYGE